MEPGRRQAVHVEDGRGGKPHRTSNPEPAVPSLFITTPPSVRAALGDPAGSRGLGLVLIADDTFDTRELYEVYLTGQGFVVKTVTDGEAAVEVATAIVPDVIVMDISMPRLDGVAATRLLKEHPRTRHVPVVIWTAYPHKAIQRGALEAGADAFMVKPCLPEELENHLRSLIPSAQCRGPTAGT
jgi:two-component system, cell cycle response regulator DivK